jgi:hypothetical protein
MCIFTLDRRLVIRAGVGRFRWDLTCRHHVRHRIGKELLFTLLIVSESACQGVQHVHTAPSDLTCLIALSRTSSGTLSK